MNQQNVQCRHWPILRPTHAMVQYPCAIPIQCFELLSYHEAESEIQKMVLTTVVEKDNQHLANHSSLLLNLVERNEATCIYHRA